MYMSVKTLNIIYPQGFMKITIIVSFRYCGSLLNADTDNKIPLNEDRALQALAGGLKAYSTWEAVDTLQICRECTGGMVGSKLFISG